MDTFDREQEDAEGDADHTGSIVAAAGRLAAAHSRGDLGHILALEMATYSLFELQIIGGRLNGEIDRLPSPYREKIRPFFRQQLFGAHHELLQFEKGGVFQRMNLPIRDLDTFKKFCGMIPEGCRSWNDDRERNIYFRDPRNRLFYYLVAAFTMFVLERPGHPVGMPFPGGFTVEQRGDKVFCLIRDREKEVPYSICNFCPAQQREE